MQPKNKGGRPNVYDTKIKPNLHFINILKANGVSNEEIIELLGVSKSVFYKHQREIEEFMHSNRIGNDFLIDKLEANLFQLAMGLAKETTITTIKNANGSVYQTTETVRIHKPDRAAITFALTNLKGDKWKYRNEVVVDDNDDAVPSFEETMKKQLGGAN